MTASQSNACELQLRDANIIRSWDFLTIHLADENLWVVGTFYTNVDKLNLLDWVLLVLSSLSPTLSSSLSSPWPSYHWHHLYHSWTECVHIYLLSVGCRQQILLEHLSPKIKFCTFCSSPVTEDVPPRRDRSSHGVPPSVTGLVHPRSVPLHPTSVTWLVHSRSIHTKC